MLNFYQEIENDSSYKPSIKPFWDDKLKNVDEWICSNTTSSSGFAIPNRDFYKKKNGFLSHTQSNNKPFYYSPNNKPHNKTNKTLVKAERYIIIPTKEEKQILQEFFGVFRWFYNRTIDYMKEYKDYNFISISKGMKNGKKFIYPEWAIDENGEEKVTPVVIMGAIRDCCKAFKSCKAKNKPFELHYKTKKDLTQTLIFQTECFGKKGLLKKYKLNNLKCYILKNHKKKDISFTDINHDFRISYKNGKYYLINPVDSPMYESQVDREIALDPGVRTFLTGYSPEGYTVHLGKDCGTRYNTYFKKIDGILSKIDLIRNGRKGYSNKKIRYLLRRLQHYRSKLQSLRDNLHWRICDQLTKHYSTIYLEDFHSSEILRKRNISKTSKRILASQSHYLFKQRLMFKCEERGVKLILVNPSFTSKTCSSCGYQNDIGSKKEYQCKGCDIHWDRDENAAKNIYLRGKYIDRI